MQQPGATMEADYLLIGAGAFGLAFLDELINNTEDITVVVVDKRAKPGGHWNDAYPFVRLHQPAENYGVNSRILGQGGADLASKYQILAYYEHVMEDLTATGRVFYYPQCEYVGEGRFVSLLDSDLKYEVRVKKKTVDGTRLTTEVPATSPPKYQVAKNVNLIPINGLADVKTPWKKYVVIGAGKTGLDALLFLLDNNVEPGRIVWIVSNDCWYFNRDMAEMRNVYDAVTGQWSAVLKSGTLDEVYENWESAGVLMRIDKMITPTKMRAATVSPSEMRKLSLITNIVRLGRIDTITESKIVFAGGEELLTDTDTLHIDCSASGTTNPPVKTIFSGSTINLQMVQVPQPTFSGAIIAAMEIAFPDDDEKKNAVCVPMGFPHEKADWLSQLRQTMINADKIGETLGFRWMRSKRLCHMSHVSMLDLAWVMIYVLQNKAKLYSKMDEILEKQK